MTAWRLLRDRSGATAIFAALTMTTVVGFVGLGVDVGLWYHSARIAQAAADSAARAAAIAAAASRDPRGAAQREARAIVAHYNLVGGRKGTEIVVNLPPLRGPHRDDKTAVEVTIVRPLPLVFAGGFITDPEPLSVRAVAAQRGKRPADVALVE
jgi:uncharacterized membrane protein